MHRTATAALFLQAAAAAAATRDWYTQHIPSAAL